MKLRLLGLPLLFGLLLIGVFFFLESQEAQAQVCTGVAGTVKISSDSRTIDANHFVAEFTPANAYQNAFTANLTGTNTVTTPMEYLGCFSTEDTCYGAFVLPSGTVAFATGIQTTTTMLEQLRVDGCRVLVVPTRVRWEGYTGSEGSVSLFDGSGALVQFNAHKDGSWNAFVFTNGLAVNVTDQFVANATIVTQTRGTFLNIRFTDFCPPLWDSCLTQTTRLSVQIPTLYYRLGENEELQLERGIVDLSRYPGRSFGMQWPVRVVDPSKCPELVDITVVSMSITGTIMGNLDRSDIVEMAVFNQDGTAKDALAGVYTHTFLQPGSYRPIVYGYNLVHEPVCMVPTKQTITVPTVVTPTPTPVPTPVPLGQVIVMAEGPFVFSLLYEGMVRPKLISVTTITRTFLIEATTPFTVPKDTLYFNPHAPRIVVETDIAQTDGRVVFIKPKRLLIADLRK